MILIIYKGPFKPCSIAVPDLTHAILLAGFPLSFVELAIDVFALALTGEEVVQPEAFVGEAVFVDVFAVAAFFVLDEGAGVVGAIFQDEEALTVAHVVFVVTSVCLSVVGGYFMIAILF